MLYELIFRVALFGVAMAGIGFLIYCWFAFREDREPHAIYEMSSASCTCGGENENGKNSVAKDRRLKISA
jgi:hypothetical protein